MSTSIKEITENITGSDFRLIAIDQNFCHYCGENVTPHVVKMLTEVETLHCEK